jgi:hypothetical protein
MRAIWRFIIGYWLGRIGIVVALICIGIMLGGGTGEQPPVAAERAKQEAAQQQRLSGEAEEEERQAEYAAEPGAPAPTASFKP